MLLVTISISKKNESPLDRQYDAADNAFILKVPPGTSKAGYLEVKGDYDENEGNWGDNDNQKATFLPGKVPPWKKMMMIISILSWR